MAFKFTAQAGNNGGTYYVTDVTWGVKDMPTGVGETPYKADQNKAQKMICNGRFVILREGKRYSAMGVEW